MTHLRMSRAVSKEYKAAIDKGFQSHTFVRAMAVRAYDFRGDVARYGLVCPPFVHDRGIERMLHEDDWNELVATMRECVGDFSTQTYIMKRLRTLLFYPQYWEPFVDGGYEAFVSALASRNKSSELAHTVAWVLRMHPHRLSLQLDCCYVLCYVNHTVVADQCPHTPYIIASLADVMQEYPLNVEVQIVCLRALEDFAQEFLESCYDIHNVIDADTAEDRFQMDVSGLLETGKHNTIMLTVRVLQQNPTEYPLNLLAIKVLTKLINILVRTQRTIIMHTYLTYEVESAILDCVSRHADSLDDIVRDHNVTAYTNIVVGLAEQSLRALHSLAKFDFWGLRRLKDIMQAATNTAVKHGSGSVSFAGRLVSEILTLLQTSPLQYRDMQNRAADVGIVHVMMTHFMQQRIEPRYCCDRDYAVCPFLNGLFRLLTVMCTNNAHVTTRMRRANVFGILLPDPCAMGPETKIIHQKRAKLLKAMQSGYVDGDWDGEEKAIAGNPL